MSINVHTILGISPGTKEIGFALVRQGRLIDWRVRTYRGPWSSEKCTRILRRIERTCKKERVGHLALKLSHEARTSHGLRVLEEGILSLAQSRGIRVSTGTIDCLKECTLQVNKRGLAKALLGKYPILQEEYAREKKNRNSYYMKIFEAVCVIEHARSFPRKLL